MKWSHPHLILSNGDYYRVMLISLGLLGLVLLIIGGVGRLVPVGVICAQCSFDLRGHLATRRSRTTICPECGARLTAQTVLRGRVRRSRRRTAITGAFLLVAGWGPPALEAGRPIAAEIIRTLSTTSFLLARAENGDMASLDVVRSRARNRSLDQDDVQHCVDLATDRMRQGALRDQHTLLIEDLNDSGLLTDQQRASLHEVAMTLELAAPKRVTHGGPIPLKVTGLWRGGSIDGGIIPTLYQWQHALEFRAELFEIDDHPMPLPDLSRLESAWWRTDSAVTTELWWDPDRASASPSRMPADLALGPHTVKLRVIAEWRPQSEYDENPERYGGNIGRERLAAQGFRTSFIIHCQATVEVVGSGDEVVDVEDATLHAQIARTVRWRWWTPPDRSPSLALDKFAGDAPHTFRPATVTAFEVIVWHDGTYWTVGTAVLGGDGDAGTYVYPMMDDWPAGATPDEVILRPFPEGVLRLGESLETAFVTEEIAVPRSGK